MNRSTTLYAVAIFFLAMVGGAALAVFRVNLRSGDDRAVSIVSRRDAHEQAAKWIFHQTPFFYRFQTKAAYLPGLFPFTQDLGRIARQNSSGFRTIEYTIAHPPKTFRILILGNGLIWAGTIPLERTFPYVSSVLINEKCRNFHTEVIALGMNGSRLADNLIRLLVHGQSLNPDLVIFQMSPEDLSFYDYGKILNLHRVPQIYAAYCAKQGEVLSPDSTDWKVFVETLDAIKKWSADKKTPVAFLVFPEIDGQRGGNNYLQYDPQRVASMPQISQFYKAVDQIKSKGFPTLYLLDAIKATKQYLTVSEQIGDLNIPAQRMAAENLVSFLYDQHLIDCNQQRLKPADPLWTKEQPLRQQAAAEWEKFNKDFTAQLPFYQKLADLYPLDPWVAKELADVFFNLKQYRSAYRTYRSLADLAPQVSAPWFHMAVSGTSPEERARLFEKMLQEVPEHTPAMEALAPIYFQRNRKKEGCKLVSTLMEIPSYTEQYLNAKEVYEENACGANENAALH